MPNTTQNNAPLYCLHIIRYHWDGAEIVYCLAINVLVILMKFFFFFFWSLFTSGSRGIEKKNNLDKSFCCLAEIWRKFVSETTLTEKQITKINVWFYFYCQISLDSMFVHLFLLHFLNNPHMLWIIGMSLSSTNIFINTAAVSVLNTWEWEWVGKGDLLELEAYVCQGDLHSKATLICD